RPARGAGGGQWGRPRSGLGAGWVELFAPGGQLVLAGADLFAARVDLRLLLGELLLGREGVDDGLDAVERAHFIEDRGQGPALVRGERRFAGRVDDDRALAAGRVRELGFEAVGHLLRRRAGDGDGRRQR